MKSLLSFSAMLLLQTMLVAQNLHVNFVPMYGNEAIALHESACQKGELQITRLRFYISAVSLKKGNKTVWKEASSYHLIDAESPESMLLNLNIPSELKYDSITFLLGIDSLTNVSGAMGGDLDPTKGMYWTWNSGYINFKLEGTHPDCPARKHKFQLHLGGYTYPYRNSRSMCFSLSGNKASFGIDIQKIMQKIDWQSGHSVMQPSKIAEDMMNWISKECLTKT